MSATAFEYSPLDESQVAARIRRIARLTLIVFKLTRARRLGGTNNEFDDVENAELIAALNACCFYTTYASCLSNIFDNPDEPFYIEIHGIDGHRYIIGFSLLGPGVSIHAARVRVTTLSLLASREDKEGGGTNHTFEVQQDYSKRLKLDKVTTDRAFLIGMSLVIGFMDEQDDDPDEDARLAPLLAQITPTDDELSEIRAELPPPSINYGEATPPLPDGTKVRVEPTELERDIDALRDLLLSVAGKAQGLPPDLAAQHDHYLHGQPKR